MKDWQTLWDRSPIYRQTLEKRITGQMPPMEANTYIATALRHAYRDGDTVLDAGCGAGHFLRLFTEFVPQEKITGLDVSPNLLSMAQQHFPRAAFVTATIEDFKSSQPFDHVICCNVLMHVDNLREAIDALLRLSRKTLCLRMLIGNSTFLIRHVHNTENFAGMSDTAPADELDADGNPREFHHFNIYSRAFVASLLQRPDVAGFDIIPDTFMNPEALQSEKKGRFQTRVVDGQYVIGNIICPWTYVHVHMRQAP